MIHLLNSSLRRWLQSCWRDHLTEKMVKTYFVCSVPNPKFSHYPEVLQSWPVIKKNQHQQYATDIFYETSVQITTDGPRHLGAVKKTLKKLYSLFLWMGFNCFKATEPLQGGSLLRSIEYKRTYIQEKTGQ